MARRPGERVDLLITIDRTGEDYRAGAAARRAGEPRDGGRVLAWVVGWDDAQPR